MSADARHGRVGGVSLECDKAVLEHRILAGQRAIRQIRFHFGLAMILFGLVCMALYLALLRRSGWGHFQEHGAVDLTAFDQLCICAMAFLYSLRFLSFSMAPLANDKLLTRSVLVFDCIGVGIDVAYMWLEPLFMKPKAGMERTFVWRLYYTIPFLTYFPVMLWVGCKENVVEMQALMWSVLTFFASLLVLEKLGECADGAFRRHVFSASWWWVLAGIMTLFVTSWSRFRDILQAKLLRFFEHHGATFAAAGIASLVGDKSPDAVFAEASSRFRCVLASQIVLNDIQDSTPSPELFKKSAPAKLNRCDAFISHSWHDDAASKWQALQAWRQEFLVQNRREPLVWFDKHCIEQDKIEENLRCLPVFVWGCNSLVILCGATYLSRLWCIVEVFSFVHVGGLVDRIKFYELTNYGQAQTCSHDYRNAANAFDVRHCDCQDKRDKEKMLCIIRAAFGSFDNFNTILKSVMQDVGISKTFSKRSTASTDRTLSLASSLNLSSEDDYEFGRETSNTDCEDNQLRGDENGKT